MGFFLSKFLRDSSLIHIHKYHDLSNGVVILYPFIEKV